MEAGIPHGREEAPSRIGSNGNMPFCPSGFVALSSTGHEVE